MQEKVKMTLMYAVRLFGNMHPDRKPLGTVYKSNIHNNTTSELIFRRVAKVELSWKWMIDTFVEQDVTLKWHIKVPLTAAIGNIASNGPQTRRRCSPSMVRSAPHTNPRVPSKRRLKLDCDQPLQRFAYRELFAPGPRSLSELNNFE